MRERMFHCGIALSGNGSVYISSLVNAMTYDVIRMLTVGGPGVFKLFFPFVPFYSLKVLEYIY